MNEIIHSPTRLRIMAMMMEEGIGRRVSFKRLTETLGVTKGNLSVQLRKLEAAGYIRIIKSFSPSGVPATHVELTTTGRGAFILYVRDLRKVLGRLIDL